MAYLYTLGNWTGEIFSYDPMGRVAFNGVCFPFGCGNGGYDKYISYAYDWAGNLTLENDNAASGAIQYGWSPAGEITSITNNTYNDAYNPGNLVSNVQNGPFGPTSWSLGNGLAITQSFDALGRLNGRWAFAGQTQLYGFVDTTRGPRVISSCDTVLNTCQGYGYDEFNRLSWLTVGQGTPQNFSWTYDRYGNRWTQNVTAGSGPSWSASFNTQNNEVIGYSYDAAGNLVNDGTHTYQYDAKGNILNADGGSTAAYTYDALNQRIQVQTPSATNNFLFDAAGKRI
jgi:hypothetical protein